VLLAVRVADLQKILEARQVALKNQVELDNPNPGLVQILKRSVDETAEKLQLDIGYYKDTVADVAQDYSLGVLDPQINVLERELTEQGRRNMADYVEKLRKHLVAFRATGEIASQAILADLK
jgi:hypothetical protein